LTGGTKTAVTGAFTALIAVMAFFLGRATAIRRETQPRFSCEINESFSPVGGEEPSPDSIVFVLATVTNHGAPSTADGYTVKVELMDKTFVTGRTVPIPENLPIAVSSFQGNITSDQELAAKTSFPVGRDGVEHGFVMAVFDGLSDEQYQSSVARLILSLSDSRKAEVSCSRAAFSDNGPHTDEPDPGPEE
jgi:hypothetical protein